MTSEVKSGMLSGIQGVLVTIQTDISEGLPLLQMIGYLGAEVKEAKERVRTALKNSGYFLPVKRIAVNLAPGDFRKNGVFFDLGIAISILESMEILTKDSCDDFIILGELSLDGRILPVQGVLPILYEAMKQGIRKCVIPRDNMEEGQLLEGMEVFGVETLRDAIALLQGKEREKYMEYMISEEDEELAFREEMEIDFNQIKGQQEAKRATIIAAAGFHNLLLEGTPGSGKSMIAAAMPGIMPPLSWEEKLEVMMIHSAKGILSKEMFHEMKRPYRTPGAGITKAGLFGGGRYPVPGEVTLAHRGVLFLDEITEMDRYILENLRVPLERHYVEVNRQEQTIQFPADFSLICACNPCPCGYFPDRSKCRCSASQIRQYQSKISGPIKDRIDLFVHCEAPSYYELVSEEENEKLRSSKEIRKEIMKAWNIQKERQGNLFNGRLTPNQIKQYCVLDSESARFMEGVYQRLRLTGRTYFKILKVARTIADLKEREQIQLEDLQEALQYRTTEFSQI